MDRTMDVSAGGRAITRSHDAAYHSYQILHVAFVVAPTLAGLDKFFHLLTNWDQYLAPAVARLLPFSGHLFMRIVGIIELVAALIVLLKPRVGAWIVAAWLLGIIVNLVLAGGFYDVALRDLGLLLGAVALARLSSIYDTPAARASG